MNPFSKFQLLVMHEMVSKILTKFVTLLLMAPVTWCLQSFCLSLLFKIIFHVCTGQPMAPLSLPLQHNTFINTLINILTFISLSLPHIEISTWIMTKVGLYHSIINVTDCFWSKFIVIYGHRFELWVFRIFSQPSFPALWHLQI